MVSKTVTLRNVGQFTGETSGLESLFKEVAGLRACKFINKRHQHRCFPEKFAKFLKASFLIEQLPWLLFKITNNDNPTIYSKIFQHYPLRTINV